MQIIDLRDLEMLSDRSHGIEEDTWIDASGLIVILTWTWKYIPILMSMSLALAWLSRFSPAIRSAHATWKYRLSNLYIL